MWCVKAVKLSLAFILMASASLSSAGTLSDADILDRTAALRTLAVSVAKHYVHVASGIEVEASRAGMEADALRFTENMRLLRMQVPDTYAREGLKQLDAEWSGFSDMLAAQPTPERVESLIESSNTLIFLADNLANNWRGLVLDPNLEALNLAHMQAMLSERIGLLYGAHFYGLKDDWVVGELNATLHEYERGLVFLERFLGEDKRAEHLDQVASQWAYAKQGFARFNEGQYLPKVIAVTMNSMQTEMAQMAEYYADLHQQANDSVVTLTVPGLAANLE